MDQGRSRAFRALARCASLEEFIAGFARFAEGNRFFIATPTPRPMGGGPWRFVMQLADGSTALAGIVEVVEAHASPTGPLGNRGMWLRLVQMTPASREVHRQLLARRARPPEIASPPAAPPPRALGRPTSSAAVPPPLHPRALLRSPSMPPIEPLGARPDATPVPVPGELPRTYAQELRAKARRLAGPSPFHEERCLGGALQLPANPLAALPDELLGQFVECTFLELTDDELAGRPAIDEADPVPSNPSAPDPALAADPGEVEPALVPARSARGRALLLVLTMMLSTVGGVAGVWLVRQLI